VGRLEEVDGGFLENLGNVVARLWEGGQSRQLWGRGRALYPPPTRGTYSGGRGALGEAGRQVCKDRNLFLTQFLTHFGFDAQKIIIK
jgi:hypothetical protein